MNKNPLFTWQFMVLKLAILALVGIAVDRPVGSIHGRLSIEKIGFNLRTYNMKDNAVFVTAQGEGPNAAIERGVWVNQDGTFTIAHLPKGEYSLKACATGFNTYNQAGIFVDDGKTVELGNDIALGVQEPSVNIASNNRVFTSVEQPHFWINASGAYDAVLKVYSMDALKMIEHSGEYDAKKKESVAEASLPARLNFGGGLEIYKPYQANEAILRIKEKPLITLTRNLVNGSDNWARSDFKLSKPLPKGDYFVVAEVNGYRNQKDWAVLWFNVSDVGLIAKLDRSQMLVRAFDLNTLKPQKGVSIRLYNRIGQEPEALGNGGTPTDAQGFAHIAIPDNIGGATQLLAVGSLGKNRTYGGLSGISGFSDSDRYRTYFYTERPVYRLGQTVFFKTITREQKNGALTVPQKGLEISAVVEDPDNNKLWEKTCNTNDHGTFWGSCDIPKDGKTGAYQITFTYPDGTTSSQAFEIAQYRKPEYEVSVTAVTPKVVLGQTGKVRIKANYYFGSPVANAHVKYTVYAGTDSSLQTTLMPPPAYYSYFLDWDDFTDGANNMSGSYGGDYISEGTVQTDQNGEALVEVATTRPELNLSAQSNYDYADKRYKVEAEVTDLSRMTVASSGTFAATIGNFALFDDQSNGITKAGEQIISNITAVDYDGHPVANKEVSVTLARFPWDSAAGQVRERQLIGNVDVVTDSAGKAVVKFPTDKNFVTDSYNLAITAKDDLNNIVYDSGNVWVMSDISPYYASSDQAQKQGLALRADKKAYQPGDTAKVLLTAPVTGQEGLDALVTLEAESIRKYWTVRLDASAKLIEIPIDQSLEPNVYLNVAFVGKNHTFSEQSVNLKVSPANHGLNIAIETDKKKYHPGDTAKYTLKATYPDGRAAANAELSMGLVDESIYAIRPETAPEIVKFFYSRLNNDVQTICTFPESYSGGPDKIEPRVRKDFRDTAVWLPALKTDANGIAIANVKLPDNLTTWRATVRGCGEGNNFGMASNKVISYQDFIVRLALPRFYACGDKALVTAIVHNYTDQNQDVLLKLAMTPQLKADESLTTHINVAPDVASRYCWHVTAEQAGEAKITVKAIGRTAGDAMETKLNVNPLGIPAFSAKNGVLVDQAPTASLPVGLTSDIVPNTVNYSLIVAPSTLGPVLGNFSTLIEYPYGCTEQTMSKLMPSVVAMTMHNKLGLPLTKKALAKFNEVYKQSMAKLDGYQHSDGGWGWWETDNSNVYLTCLVLDGYKQLRSVGFAIDLTRASNGLNYLKTAHTQLFQELSDPLHKEGWYDADADIDLARACYTLALYDIKPDPKALEFLTKNMNTFTPETLSYLLMADKKLGNSEAAQKVYARLMDLANKSDGYIDWTPSKRMISKIKLRGDQNNIWEGYYCYSYRYTNIESTALVMRAILKVDSQNSAVLDPIKSWLLVQRDQNGWDNTKTTSEVFLALLEEQLASGTAFDTKENLEVSKENKLITSILFDEKNLYDPATALNIPLPTAPGSFTLTKTGPGRIYYSSLLKYERKLLPGDNIAAKSMPAGLTMTRTLMRIVPNATKADGTPHFTTQPITDNTAHAGETLLLKVDLSSPIAVPYVMVECPLPSGAEVIDQQIQSDLEGNTRDSTDDPDAQQIGDWGGSWWTHQDILDDKIVFFVTNLKAGKNTFSTLVRVEMPGTFQVAPMRIEGMYTDKVRGYSNLGLLKVVE